MDPQDSARKIEALTIFSLAFGGNAALKAGVGLARNIPMAGALVGAGGNAVMTYALGASANQYYKAILSGKENEEALSEGQQKSEQVLEEAIEQENALDGILAHMILAGHPECDAKNLEEAIGQLPLEENARRSIKKHIHSLREFDVLLQELQPEYGLVALAQAERLARSDAKITEAEQVLLDKLETHFREEAEILDQMRPSNYILTQDFKHTVRGLQFSRDGMYLCAAGDDKSLKIWKTYDECLSFQLIHDVKDAHRDAIKALAMSPNDEFLVLASKNRKLSFWEYRNGKLLRTIESGHRKGINALVFCDDKTLASGSDDGEIKIWNVDSGAIRRSLLGHKNSVLSLAVSPISKHVIASGSNDHHVRLWNATTGETLHDLEGHKFGIYSLAFSPNGQTLASGSWDRRICLWDVTSGEQYATLEGHTAAVWQLLFTPDGNHLVSSSDDNSIFIWDLLTKQIRVRLDGHRHGVYSLALAPNKSIIASGSWDNSVRIWSVDLDS
ncbi:WD40 repeat domain-containing protein [Lyngbya confervoides]|uniref:WD40 repeat domain-containing protein n=1 Tax=Lyngbya confervoides BDU141951 TaxID=1574623 RepID=A0ABD4T2T8_9CYAN|nr:WD40 repeat domain-containing protein [Lyngbya confervoides]MCM1982974.1 WD40 repeat domain-containing protein [Lyngbya confervoides BDU141951]